MPWFTWALYTNTCSPLPLGVWFYVRLFTMQNDQCACLWITFNRLTIAATQKFHAIPATNVLLPMLVYGFDFYFFFCLFHISIFSRWYYFNKRSIARALHMIVHIFWSFQICCAFFFSSSPICVFLWFNILFFICFVFGNQFSHKHLMFPCGSMKFPFTWNLFTISYRFDWISIVWSKWRRNSERERERE